MIKQLTEGMYVDIEAKIFYLDKTVKVFTTPDMGSASYKLVISIFNDPIYTGFKREYINPSVRAQNWSGRVEVKPMAHCLYMIGQVGFNPETCEIIYCIKVGKASDIESRMTNYRTHSPLTYFIDQIKINVSKGRSEFTAHCKIRNAYQGIRMGSTEWFMVSKETYIYLSQNGFADFFKK